MRAIIARIPMARTDKPRLVANAVKERRSAEITGEPVMEARFGRVNARGTARRTRAHSMRSNICGRALIYCSAGIQGKEQSKEAVSKMVGCNAPA